MTTAELCMRSNSVLLVEELDSGLGETAWSSRESEKRVTGGLAASGEGTAEGDSWGSGLEGRWGELAR